jgi:hypothetical protein
MIALDSFLGLVNKLFIFLAMIGSNAILLLDLPAYLYYRIFFPIFVILVLCLFFAKSKLVLKISKILKENIIFLGFLSTYSFISIFWAPSNALSLRYSLLLFSQVVLSIVITFITREKIVNYVHFLIKLFIFSEIVALLQIFNIVKFETGYSVEFENIGAFSFYGFNEFAYIITIFYPILLAYNMFKNKFTVLSIILLSIFLLLFTGSVLGLFSIFFESILFIFLTSRYPKTGVSKLTVICIISVSLIVLFNIGYFIELISKYNISTRVINQFITQLSFNSQDESLSSYRFELMLYDLNLIMKTYLFGVGAGGDSFYIMEAGLPGNSHNWLLEIFTNFGIFTFVVYVILLIDSLRMLIRIYRNSKLPDYIRNISLGLFLGLITLPINGMMVSSLLKLNSFWIYYGIIIAFCDRYYFISCQEDLVCIV